MIRQILERNGIDVFTTDKGLLGKTTFLDPRGMNARSMLADKQVWQEVLRQHRHLDTDAAERFIASYSKALQSGWEQPQYCPALQLRQEFGIESKKQIVFIPTQVLSDVNMILYHGRFHDNLWQFPVKIIRQYFFPESHSAFCQVILLQLDLPI